MSRTNTILKYVKGPRVLNVSYVGQSLAKGYSEWLHEKLIQNKFDVLGIDILEVEIENEIKKWY